MPASRRFFGDSSAVIELPFKLVIATIVMFATASVAFAGIDTYSYNQAESSARAAAERIASGAAEVAAMGVNSSVRAEFEISGGPMHETEYIEIGCGVADTGGPGQLQCKCIRYKIQGTGEQRVMVKDHAGRDILLKSQDGAVVFRGGHHALLLLRQVGYIEILEI